MRPSRAHLRILYNSEMAARRNDEVASTLLVRHKVVSDPRDTNLSSPQLLRRTPYLRIRDG